MYIRINVTPVWAEAFIIPIDLLAILKKNVDRTIFHYIL